MLQRVGATRPHLAALLLPLLVVVVRMAACLMCSSLVTRLSTPIITIAARCTFTAGFTAAAAGTVAVVIISRRRCRAPRAV